METKNSTPLAVTDKLSSMVSNEDKSEGQSDGYVDWPEPTDNYSPDNPIHLAIEKLRVAIGNFLIPDAAETLKKLAGNTVDDLQTGYSSKCMCGCYNRNSVFDSFENAELESLKYI